MITHDQLVHFAAHFGMSATLFFLACAVFSAHKVIEFEPVAAIFALIVGIAYKLTEAPTIHDFVLSFVYNVVGVVVAGILLAMIRGDQP